MELRTRVGVAAVVILGTAAAVYAVVPRDSFQPPPSNAQPSPGEHVVFVLAKEGRLGALSKLMTARYEVRGVGEHVGYVKVAVPEGVADDAFKKTLAGEADVKDVLSPVRGETLDVPPDELFDLQWALRNTGTNAVDCPAGVECFLLRTEEVAAGGDGGCSCSTDPVCPYDDPPPHPSQAGVDINVEAAWDTTKGDGVIVAVIDMEFQRGHPDLEGALFIPEGAEDACASDFGIPNTCFGRRFDHPTLPVGANEENNFTHGGFIASQIGARWANGADGDLGMVGVAPESTVMMLQVSHMLEAAEAIEFAVDNGAQVINHSLAWFKCQEDFDTTEAIFRDAMSTAQNAGVAFVQAAGNYGTSVTHCDLKDPAAGSARRVCNFDMNSAAEVPSPVNLAPDFPNMVVVSAVGRDGARPGFAMFGSNFTHVFAPGAWVLGVSFDWDDNGAERWMNNSGTSHAAPYVAGTLALVVAAKDITGLEAIDHVRETVNPDPVVSVFRSDVAWGGMVDASAAVAYTP